MQKIEIMKNSFTISGHVVDLVASRIFEGTVVVENGKIKSVKEEKTDSSKYILPGLIDSHVHIESSMVTPAEFARMAVCHGTVATVSDPHEIANVLGIDGVKFMIESGKKVPFKFYFGAPSCVPATTFETSGFVLDHNDIATLMNMDDIYYLGEMMNYPGVVFGDPEVHAKLEAARCSGKPIDGHAPSLSGDNLKKYVDAGISTDHECFTEDEAEEKINLGMKILIREGSAAKNFEALVGLIERYPDQIMFCSDDKHPNDLVSGHINTLVKRAIEKGYNILDVLKAASLNVIKHYNLNVGLLQQGDSADFIVVDNLSDFNVEQTYIDGQLVAENGKSMLVHIESTTPNNFKVEKVKVDDFKVADNGKNIKVIECIDGQLITKVAIAKPKVENGNMVSDTGRDILKMVVVNRYTRHSMSIGFIKNFGLKKGAIASSIAHDSHNIVAVGTSDQELTDVINKLIETKGGIAVSNCGCSFAVGMPIAGLMSNEDGYKVATDYEKIDAMAKELGTPLHAPFMTLAFMSLLVIPELKLGDKGLFDVNKFAFTELSE